MVSRRDFGRGLEEIDAFATGASLIKRKVFEKIEYPEPVDKLANDADVEFCFLARRSNFKIYTDFDLVATHTMLADIKKNLHTITP